MRIPSADKSLACVTVQPDDKQDKLNNQHTTSSLKSLSYAKLIKEVNSYTFEKDSLASHSISGHYPLSQ